MSKTYPNVLFLFVFWLSSILCLVGCSRAPQAYVQRTPYVTYARPEAPAAKASTADVPSAELTASVNTPPAPTKPAWNETPATTPASVEPAIAVTVRRSTAWSRVKRMMPRKPVPPGCDQIVLRNGDVVDAKVKEVGVNEIRYKKCDRQDGPDYTIAKRDVLSIKYSNGEVERFGNSSSSSSSSSGQSYQSPTSPQNDGPKTDPFAIVAISAGGLAFLTGLGSFLFGAAAIVFGAISLSRIKKQPDRFKGKGLALAGMIAGIVAAAFWFSYAYLF